MFEFLRSGGEGGGGMGGISFVKGEFWIMFSIICFLLISAHGISASVCVVCSYSYLM